MNKKVLIHIVTWNSARTIERCLELASQQEEFTLGEDLFIRVTDNASLDTTCEKVKAALDAPGTELRVNSVNLGFSAAHNQGASACVAEQFDALLILNPDVGLPPTCLRDMVLALESGRGIITPKLLRAGEDLSPLSPPTIDAAGMELTSAVRHFDRGSGIVDAGQFDEPGAVFGGTGACLLVSRECIESVAIPKTISDEAVWRVYPELREGASERIQLFDEAFFAYREDADLSWRAQRMGWQCWYEPKAVAYHVRVVTPERRAKLPAKLNAWSVRNRFLLQCNNWSFSCGVRSFVEGILLRNLIVVAGVLLREHTSRHALLEAVILASRARSIFWATECKRDSLSGGNGDRVWV
jgi:GT2 family glycosyltransferase